MDKKPAILVEVKMEWAKEPGDSTHCSACNDPIYGNMYCLGVTIGSKTSWTENKFCENCYYKINHP
jgi:hypothetical protein